MGDVTDLSNFMGAVIDRKSFAKLSGVLDRAKDDDALTVVAGGTARRLARASSCGRRSSRAPTPAHEVFTTEYFGPILAVHVYDDADYDAVLTQMESVAPYALTGSIIAQDRAAIAHAAAVLRFAAGNFYVNDKPTGAVVGQQPFGGGAGLRHQRQGRRRAEPDALDQHAVDQGDVRPADRLPLPAHGRERDRPGQPDRPRPPLPGGAVRGQPAVGHEVGAPARLGSRTATSAMSRRWQRHHTLSLHMTATVVRAASASTSSSAAGTPASACARRRRRTGRRSTSRRPPVRRREPAPAAEPLVPPVADAVGGQPLLERLPLEVGVCSAAGEPPDVDDEVDPGAA